MLTVKKVLKNSNAWTDTLGEINIHKIKIKMLQTQNFHLGTENYLHIPSQQSSWLSLIDAYNI